MSHYSQKFIIGWSIGLAVPIIFNLYMFLAPALYELIFSSFDGIESVGILLTLLFWPLILVGAGLSIFGVIFAIVVDIIMLLVFYSAQKKHKLSV